MAKVLTEPQVRTFERDGCLSPVRAMSAERARHYRARFEALEARVPDIKKMKTKSHLLCPWVLEIAEDPHILDIFEDLIGPNIRCWSMAWRVKKADGETFAGRHQDSAYGAATPVVLGGLALSELLANWAAAVNSRATLIFEDSRVGPSEAYGGKRPAT
jgi:hypothetical protein